MTADAADLVDSEEWKPMMPPLKNEKIRMLCLANIKKNMVEIDADPAHICN